MDPPVGQLGWGGRLHGGYKTITWDLKTFFCVAQRRRLASTVVTRTCRIRSSATAMKPMQKQRLACETDELVGLESLGSRVHGEMGEMLHA